MDNELRKRLGEIHKELIKIQADLDENYDDSSLIMYMVDSARSHVLRSITELQNLPNTSSNVYEEELGKCTGKTLEEQFADTCIKVNKSQYKELMKAFEEYTPFLWTSGGELPTEWDAYVEADYADSAEIYISIMSDGEIGQAASKAEYETELSFEEVMKILKDSPKKDDQTDREDAFEPWKDLPTDTERLEEFFKRRIRNLQNLQKKEYTEERSGQLFAYNNSLLALSVCKR